MRDCVLLPIPILLVALFPLLTATLIAPLAWLFLTALLSPEPWSVDPFFWHVLRFTYTQAAISAALSVVFGGVGAWLLIERSPSRWVDPILRLSSLPFALPAIVVSLAIADFWGKNGPLGNVWEPVGGLYGWTGILLAHVFCNFPLALRYIGGALAEMDRSAEKAALSLGAGRWLTFRQISWPKLRPAVTASFALAFLYCAGSFVIVLMLGGSPRFTTLEVALYQSLRAELRISAGARLALLQFLIAAGFHWLVHRPSVLPSRGTFVPLYAGRATRLPLLAFLMLWMGMVPGPLLLILGRSLVGIGMVEWDEIGRAALTSLQLSGMSASIAIAVALPLGALHHRASPVGRAMLDRLANLPLFLSPLALSLAWMVLYPDVLWKSRGSLWAIALAQGLIAVPLAYGPLVEAWARIPHRVRQAAASLGAGPWHRLAWIELPLLRRALVTAVLFTSALSIGELSAVLAFADTDISTLALLGYRYMARYRFAEASVVAAVLLLVVAALHYTASEREGDRLHAR